MITGHDAVHDTSSVQNGVVLLDVEVELVVSTLALPYPADVGRNCIPSIAPGKRKDRLLRLSKNGRTSAAALQDGLRPFGYVGPHHIQSFRRDIPYGIKEKLNVQGWALPAIIRCGGDENFVKPGCDPPYFRWQEKLHIVVDNADFKPLLFEEPTCNCQIERLFSLDEIAL